MATAEIDGGKRILSASSYATGMWLSSRSVLFPLQTGIGLSCGSRPEWERATGLHTCLSSPGRPTVQLLYCWAGQNGLAGVSRRLEWPAQQEGWEARQAAFISALPDIHGALFRSDSSGLLLPDWPKGKIPAWSLIRYRKRHKAVVVARLRVQGPRTFRSCHTKHLKCNNVVRHGELKAWCQLWVFNQNQYIQRLLALDGKCTQALQPNTHPQTHTLGFGGGVLLFFSLWPLVGESVPVARLAWGTVLCLAPGDTCMAANWAAYNCCSETERDRKRKRERRDRGRRDRRVDEEERKVHE